MQEDFDFMDFILKMTKEEEAAEGWPSTQSIPLWHRHRRAADGPGDSHYGTGSSRSTEIEDHGDCDISS